MERVPVKSSFLASIGYNPDAKMLEVEFRSGRIYQYLDVEPKTHSAMMSAESVGIFYSRGITGKYANRRAHELEPAKEADTPTLLDENNGAKSPAEQ